MADWNISIGRIEGVTDEIEPWRTLTKAASQFVHGFPVDPARSISKCQWWPRKAANGAAFCKDVDFWLPGLWLVSEAKWSRVIAPFLWPAITKCAGNRYSTHRPFFNPGRPPAARPSTTGQVGQTQPFGRWLTRRHAAI